MQDPEGESKQKANGGRTVRHTMVSLDFFQQFKGCFPD